MANFFETVIDVLKVDDRFFTAEGELLRNSVYEAAMKMDPKLIKMLFENADTKAHFFTDVDGISVFDKVGFGWVINNREFLPDSYTRYKNKIGLVDQNGNYISTSNDVELVFPYKDCVLEGGQTKEDQKKAEVFYNISLASNEIDRMLAPKVFTNALKYTKDCHKKIVDFDENDNLIIKGNNLLAIASLLKRYEGKISCIYIDPPYYFNKSKPSDAFKYNSNFKLSSWLVFMKDRLKYAYRLLEDNGVLFSHIGEDGFAYLKILLDEVFGADSFVETFIWKNTDNPDSLSKKSRSSVEYIICYEKNKSNKKIYIGKDTENGDGPLLHTGNSIHELVFPPKSIHFNIPDGKYLPSKPDRVELLNAFRVSNGLNIDEVRLKGEFVWSQETLNQELENGTYAIVKSEKFSVRCQRPEGTTMAPEKYIDEEYLSKAIGVGTNEDASSHLKALGLNFSYSKPESVVAFLLKAVTEENDIVMDFFLGSGTTAAVAQKMGRRYIGVEQMDYIKTDTIERMKRVLDGEQGGVSKQFNWQGGGSFVYCELSKLNQKYVERIQNADDSVIADIWSEMQKTGFISSKIDPKDIDPEADDFKALSLENKKRLLIELLDLNQLYINYCDIEDETFAVSEEDKAFTKSFYGEV